MIKISENIQLKEVLSSDYEFLFRLMQEIYTPAYQHFWTDEGAWYINSQYSKENILKELLDKKARYYFILFKGKIIGNFRFIWDEKLEGLPEEKQVKLHRIYLHPKTQRSGIGKLLLAWLEEKAEQKGYQIIWLDAMNEQQNAFQFYKKLGYIYYSHTFLPFELMHDSVRKMSQVYKVLH
ncbi:MULTISPECIES: GNAT family N-acetyltransferase [unclassified Polaribacter]|uniref:GNAT family N-acetyltransferase n=1 Tax=unclassified Polaribacter TaxID=196858 RepID=UPI0011BEA775|nr:MULTISPECIES: GNAT family N-acetyltransferase [unclassified Polaribacter]TXD52781.1 GNAT family N-acetyltransferase [Polaribacter sp. IC063]TXD61658.1 GNAT family N-acetyltransferase [Polaribacter sp. IC066]